MHLCMNIVLVLLLYGSAIRKASRLSNVRLRLAGLSGLRYDAAIRTSVAALRLSLNHYASLFMASSHIQVPSHQLIFKDSAVMCSRVLNERASRNESEIGKAWNGLEDEVSLHFDFAWKSAMCALQLLSSTLYTC